ncbi:hypothetical protein [Cupriavidus necator]
MPYIEQLQQAAQQSNASPSMRDFNNQIAGLVNAHASGTLTFAQYKEAQVTLVDNASEAHANGQLRNEYEYKLIVEAAMEQFNDIAAQQHRAPANQPGNRLLARRGLNGNIPRLPDNLPDVVPTGLTPLTPAPGAHLQNPFLPRGQDGAARRR